MSQTTLEVLLNKVFSIQKKYEGITKLTGENYNIFKILGVETEEVRLHSAMIADLLNPGGSHDQGATFLSIFLNLFEVKNFEVEGSTVVPEFFISSKTETEGGRIDILGIDKRENRFIIENKIYAGDQENQLIRYHNYDQKAPIFYLTLDGKSPSQLSTGDMKPIDNHIICISYKSDIIRWLELCKKEAVNFPILRETITQYIYLLKYLTNQSTNKIMSDEIAKQIIQTEDTLKAYFEANNSIEAVLNALIKKLECDLDKMAKDYNLTFTPGIDRDKKDSGFTFESEELRKINLKICFEFEETYCHEFCFGFVWHDKPNINLNLKQNLTKELETYSEWHDYSDKWPVFTKWTESKYFNWNEETYIEICNGVFCKIIMKKVLMLLKVARKAAIGMIE